MAVSLGIVERVQAVESTQITPVTVNVVAFRSNAETIAFVK